MKPLAKLRYNPGRTKLDEIIEVRVDPELYLATLESVKTPEQELIDRQEWRRVEDCIDRLMPRVALALRLKYGIGCEPHTLAQVGERFGVGRERIHQIVAKGERKLRRWLLPREKLRVLRDSEAAEERARNERRDEKYAAEESARAAQNRREQAEREVFERADRVRRAKEYAQRVYNFAYVEAHQLNAQWGDELKRRAEARQLAQAKEIQRQRDEARAALERRVIDYREAKLERRAAKSMAARAHAAERALYEGERSSVDRDWLLVGS